MDRTISYRCAGMTTLHSFSIYSRIHFAQPKYQCLLGQPTKRATEPHKVKKHHSPTNLGNCLWHDIILRVAQTRYLKRNTLAVFTNWQQTYSFFFYKWPMPKNKMTKDTHFPIRSSQYSRLQWSIDKCTTSLQIFGIHWAWCTEKHESVRRIEWTASTAISCALLTETIVIYISNYLAAWTYYALLLISM
jgi:hypothetical protein